ncbi:flagellar biosynthesis protein FlhB [Desulfatitalea alkaliphila]|uniref:Flagellar biosynthetic protein FlhB n=1 Tax=Desulfatitalea alkaliphila TaxID=2929485 RepID=A0AA41R312_9BACT|nr:flagellar biosynthesis protein FlhB [Desulfatitalea alkaliphila]MCJ8501294.1 flagellar biosynthesis protein FlhB [Desulfatitalea alkaliphila]
MAEKPEQEKTEPATPKKRQEARKKGNVAQSREIPSVVVLLSALSVFYFAGGWMFGQLGEIMRSVFLQITYSDMGATTTHAMFWQLFKKVVLLLSPLLMVVAVAGIAGNVSQFGFMITGEKMKPKLSKLNPIEGIKRLLSLRSLIELFKSVFKVLIIGSVAFAVVRRELELIPAMVELSIPAVLAYVGGVALKMGFFTCLVLIILAALDYVFQRWQHERDLRMTKQEVKDEHKQSEGDPLVRSRIRSAQREMAQRRMMSQVPDATVVITNPTHLAIAIKFERSMPAPMVVAKGAGHVAQKIKEIAAENNIPVIEEKPLARTLYKSVEIDQYIPVDLYKAVAEILAYVYRLKGLT